MGVGHSQKRPTIDAKETYYTGMSDGRGSLHVSVRACACMCVHVRVQSSCDLNPKLYIDAELFPKP